MTAPDRTATQAHPVSPPPPPAIPGFEVRELLGRGGMGFVYRARETASGRVLALKWLPRGASELLRKRFAREALATRALDHPCIVKVHGTGETPEGSYLLMELVDGFPLSTALEARALGRNALLDLVAKVARALEHAHHRGVLHRDVKPANILVDGNGEPRLVDFGLVRFVDRGEALTALTDPGAILGTFGSMAPEVLSEGGARATRASDVFSLGTVLYEGLAGRLPVSGEPRTAVAKLLRGELDPLPEDVPPEVAALGREMLALDPKARPSPRVVAERLEALLGRAPVKKVAARDTWPLRLVAAALLSVVLGMVVALTGNRRAKPAPPAPPTFTVEDPAPPAPTFTVKDPAPTPLPAPKAPAPDPERLYQECVTAIQLDDRPKAASLAREALLLAPSSGLKVKCELVLARDALLRNQPAEAEKAAARALALEPDSSQALFLSFAAALLEQDEARGRARFQELEKLPLLNPQLLAAKTLVAIARRDPWHQRRAQAVSSGGRDPVLLRHLAQALYEKEPYRGSYGPR